MEIFKNDSYTFEDIINNLREIKDDYDKILSSFLWYEIKERNNFIKEIKDKIYLLKTFEWKKNLIWNYMNGYEYYYVLKARLDIK